MVTQRYPFMYVHGLCMSYYLIAFFILFFFAYCYLCLNKVYFLDFLTHWFAYFVTFVAATTKTI